MGDRARDPSILEAAKQDEALRVKQDEALRVTAQRHQRYVCSSRFIDAVDTGAVGRSLAGAKYIYLRGHQGS